MEITNSFMLYASLFRLSIIISGTTIAYLGYKLLKYGGEKKENATSASMQSNQFTFTLKNAAPGTVFAVFGATLISLMVIQGNPELLIKKKNNNITKEEKNEKYTPRNFEISLKGSGENSLERFESLLAEGNEKQKDEQSEEALNCYFASLKIPEIPLITAAEAFNEIAWVYLGRKELDAALPLAKLAAGLSSNNGFYQNTFAEVLLEKGQVGQALQRAKMAVELERSAPHYWTLARAFEAFGDIEHGMSAMKVAVELDPSLINILQKMEVRNK